LQRRAAYRTPLAAQRNAPHPTCADVRSMPRALAGGFPHPCGVCSARAAQRRTRDDATRRQTDGLTTLGGTDRRRTLHGHCAAVQGGADVFKLGYFGKDAFLAQSPQLCAAHPSPHAARCMLHVVCRTLLGHCCVSRTFPAAVCDSLRMHCVGASAATDNRFPAHCTGCARTHVCYDTCCGWALSHNQVDHQCDWSGPHACAAQTNFSSGN
jgi:hypothetical protein